ncbi:MAG TPA: class I SAM-dependent methyltransferase [Telluria sp.]
MTKPPFPDAASTWNARFRHDEFLFGTEPNAYLASRQHLFERGQRALAVADGEGRNSVWLARQGMVVDAFDISTVGVDKARQLARQANVTVNFNVAACDSWDWQPQAYDHVVAIFVQFADPAMRARLFANMAHALRSGGYLILQGYTPGQLELNTGGPGLLEHLYTADMLEKAFAGLEIVELTEYQADLDEGRQHAGPSALIGMVARKP